MPLPNGQPTLMEAILAGEEVRLTISNKDACFSNPIQSMIDGKHYANQKQYRDHLKQHGCHEVGTDYNNKISKPREVKGDFNVKNELRQAVKQVMSK